ncbi:hypothetical protein M413DRAFT_319602 [Hebeloma cylindrosporum]|uniref:P-loop containing nucleoside triphosphate hydrolase protein n=1 Tax=Hebeloma cylindrosporum TaxID=76867 RepID=A0A0C2Y5E7_HEBCY|nr:hypothetical protein M413DRAFT_319602 [Hebeloma cylindrosporum h7]
MRRPTALAVDTTNTTNELVYELNISPRSSIDTAITDLKHDLHPESASPPQPAQPTLTPSIRLLFSLISRKHFLCLILPAIVSSLIAGGIAPFMTFVVGQAFDTFAQYPLTPNPPQAAKDALLRGVGLAALELIGLAFGSLALGSITSCLWIWAGEINAISLRKTVYAAVTQKDMVWFDMHMGATEGTVQATSEDNQQGPIGAGGLMAKFSRETDDVRMASSLASGMIIQYLTTCIACLILAFMRSWALTLVILSAVPLLMFIQGLSQGFASPLLAHEREQTGIAATVIDRAIAAIATVKAFNATEMESERANHSFLRLKVAAKRLNKVWGTTSGIAQFVMMAMFVQGFWFGAKLVREGKCSAGDVMAVFWACLIATSNLQMCIPQFITLAKGKFAMVALLTLVGNAPSAPPPDVQSPTTPNSVITTVPGSRKSRTLRKITPARCYGELALHNVTFAYPSRPTIPVLSDVSLFLPANETTFIVGSSGSGKSTVAQLLLRIYEPQKGTISLDEQDVRFLDEEWMRTNVAGVGQQGASGVVILDGKSVFDNVAAGLLGHCDRDVTREEVEDACRAALVHEFVRDLPQGYETLLGGGAGVGLSGGQKQRLSIARARLRNPTVLILDEATSALDATSRILVFEALKRWRQHKTTVVITHDLSQIEPQDFVYVLKQGRVVEQGFRYDLEGVTLHHGADQGEFRKMMESQRATGGFLPEKDIDNDNSDEELLEDDEEEEESRDKLPTLLKHQSIAIRPLTFGNWMFEVVADLTGSKPVVPVPPSRESQSYPINRFVPANKFATAPSERPRRPSSVQFPSTPTSALGAHTIQSRRYSLPFTPTSTTFTGFDNQSTAVMTVMDEGEEKFDCEKNAVRMVGVAAKNGRPNRVRTRWDATDAVPLKSVKIDKKGKESAAETTHVIEDMQRPPFWALMRVVYPTIPGKPLLFFGLLVCVLSGAMTPIFSYLLSRLLFEVSTGGQNVSVINSFGGLVLGIAAIDGLFLGSKYYIMESVGMSWITSLRSQSLSRLLAQDKKWFDQPSHTPARLVQVLVKDGEDARNLVSVVWGQCLVVVAMLGVGLVWALVRGWQLTLAGFAIAPVFAVTMAVQSSLVAGCEVRNKRAREEVSRGYYDAIINIRGIRCMSFEKIFKARFDDAADKALSTGVRGAFVEGCTYGVASGLIYLAEALLFYIGAVLIARGMYPYLQMVEVLNLVVFSVTIGSQLMGFTEKIAKSVQATSDLHKLTHLDTDTDESRGVLQPDLGGSITFNHVEFAYPERPDAPVLKDLNLEIAAGECVAIVGASGSGKSTIAALLQRLYEPSAGFISVGDTNNPTCLGDVDVRYLRDQVSVVSQQPNLFDATVAENIRYGNVAVSDVDVRVAAKKANVHEFIMGLPQGYDTMVGENASLISGGQAQRLQIARALARPSRILILDECTSALDGENQTKVLETIRKVKEEGSGRTTVMVTHKVEVMRLCERVVVIGDGGVLEEGAFEELVKRTIQPLPIRHAFPWLGTSAIC